MISCKKITLLLAPAVFSPLLFLEEPAKEYKCGFVVLLMATYWTLEPIPTAVTALLPIVLLPVLGLATTDDACKPYFKEANMLFLGCLMIAIAVENSNLHRRVALRILATGGSNYKMLLLGFMLTTAFLGMWIINTAATAMMLPIVDAVVNEIFTHANDEYEDPDADLSLIMGPESECGKIRQMSRKQRNFERKLKKLLYLSIAYSATIGGTSTLTSNGPNLVFKFVIEELYTSQLTVDYATWFFFCAPAAIVSVISLWLAFKLIYIRNDWKLKQIGTPRQIIIEKYRELGPLTFHEVSVLCLFASLVLLWLFRDPHFMKGWVNLFPKIKPKDATPAILVIILFFVIPVKPFGDRSGRTLLDWSTVQSKLPWGLILLRGGGFSMAEAVTSSGLSKLMGEQLAKLNFLSVFLIVLIFTILTTFLTEFASNSATATVLLPVAGQLASSLDTNPLFFLIPITLSCCFAFVFPVGTPANALVFEHAKLSPADMIVPGLLAKLICTIIMLLNLHTFGYYLFGLSEMPTSTS